MFALSGAPSTPSEEIVIFEELEEAELGEGESEREHVEEVEKQNIGKHFFEEGKVMETQTEYDIAVFKRLILDMTWFIFLIPIPLNSFPGWSLRRSDSAQLQTLPSGFFEPHNDTCSDV